MICKYHCIQIYVELNVGISCNCNILSFYLFIYLFTSEIINTFKCWKSLIQVILVQYSEYKSFLYL